MDNHDHLEIIGRTTLRLADPSNGTPTRHLSVRGRGFAEFVAIAWSGGGRRSDAFPQRTRPQAGSVGADGGGEAADLSSQRCVLAGCPDPCPSVGTRTPAVWQLATCGIDKRLSMRRPCRW